MPTVRRRRCGRWAPPMEIFQLPRDQTLVRWTDEQGQQWACLVHDHVGECRFCQRVDETIDACVQNVIDGLMEIKIDPSGEFLVRLTPEGKRRAAHVLRELGGEG